MAPTAHPNILVLHADQHRNDCLGACGNADIRTPHLDALAAEGVTYSNSFCSYPVCTPSRYSLLSGLYVRQHLGWTNHCTLPTGLPTFPRVLRERGYRTAAVGKMHFTPTYLDVGFDRMVLAEQDGPGRHDDDYHRHLRAHGLCDRLDLMDQVHEYRQEAPQAYWDTFGAIRSDLPEEHHSTTWIGDAALRELEGWKDGGNLLMAGFIKPHHPFDPPAPWSGMYNPGDLALLPGWTEECLPHDLAHNRGYFPHEALTEDSLRQVMAMYYAAISQIDHQVGRLFEHLQKRGLWENTLVVYTSDHGDYMGYHHMLLKGNYLYDPLARVPLIIKWPGAARAGEKNDGLVSNVDLAPTLIRQTGGEVPPTMAGLDLAAAPAGREWVFAEGWQAGQLMARSQQEKLILCQDEKRSLFFDLEADPLELQNRYADEAVAPRRQAARRALERWALFETATATHLDPEAPCCRGENVRHPRDGEAESSKQYFREKMDNAGQRVYGASAAD